MRLRAPITNFIVVVNLIVFAMWHIWDQQFMAMNFLVSWSSVEEGRYWTLLSSAFSHNLLFHFLINIFVLKSFGPLLENLLGSKNFIIFYITAAIVSSLSHAGVSFLLMGEPDQFALGASGAVAGLILLFSLFYPKEKILILGIIPLPAIVGAFLFIGFDLWGLFTQTQGGGLPIGHGAHLGGSFAGILFYFFIFDKYRKLKVY